jgi:hypothetical protein
MDSRLARLIGDYQKRVSEAVAMLVAVGIPRPSSNLAWAVSDVPGKGTLAGGFTYYKHGYGCAVHGPVWGVDFDFGDEGQIDGFDAWRLYDFAQRRPTEYGFNSEKEIEGAVKDAERLSELKYSGYILFYVTDSGRKSVAGSAG